MRRRRVGFTLVEVLLALAVGAAIMAGIFSVMRVQTRLAEEGGRRAEEAQLARALLDAIGRDIRNCAPAAGAAETRLRQAAAEIPFGEELALGGTLESAGTASYVPVEARQFNLAIVGDEARLILSPHRSVEESAETILVGKADRSAMPETGLGLGAGSVGAERARLQAGHTDDVRGGEGSGFVRVAYFMLDERGGEKAAAPAKAGGDEEVEHRRGLVRLEHKRFRSEDVLERVSEAIGRLRRPREAGDHESEPGGSSLEDSGVRAEVLAREVRTVAFRYYDGSFWHGRWDGSAGLPRAVEVELGLGEGKRSAGGAGAASSTATRPQEDEEVASEGETGMGLDTGEVRTYRLTVRVPTAGWGAARRAGSSEPEPGLPGQPEAAPLVSRQGVLR